MAPSPTKQIHVCFRAYRLEHQREEYPDHPSQLRGRKQRCAQPDGYFCTVRETATASSAEQLDGRELNSNISSKFSNVFRLTYNQIRDKRASSSPRSDDQQLRPLSKASITYNLGSENSSQANSLDQDISTRLRITSPSIPASIPLPSERTTNSSIARTFSSRDTTVTIPTTRPIQQPAGYCQLHGKNRSDLLQLGYSTSSDPSDKAAAKLNAAQFSVYGQDVWSATNRLKVTLGLRIDMPVFFKSRLKPGRSGCLPGLCHEPDA